MEVPGMDFGRLVFVPHVNWSLSLIVNTDEGRSVPLGPDPFSPIYAVKMDYTGEKAYGSFIYSRKDFKQANTFGFFGGGQPPMPWCFILRAACAEAAMLIILWKIRHPVPPCKEAIVMTMRSSRPF